MSRKTATNLMVVPSSVESAGAVVWWRLSGPTDADRLAAAWRDAGLAPESLLPLPSPDVALHRAVAEQRGPRRLVRPLGGDANGWAVVEESAEGEDLHHSVTHRVVLTKIGTLAFPSSSKDSRFALEVSGAYDRHLSELSPGDVGGWLSRLVRAHDGVALRDTGGFYFVPRTRLDEWRRAVAAVRAASNHQVSFLPALPADETVEAVLDAVRTEAQAAAEAMQAELANGLGTRALEARETACAALQGKVSRYEALLGRKMDDLRAGLETLQASLAAAAIAAMAQESR